MKKIKLSTVIENVREEVDHLPGQKRQVYAFISLIEGAGDIYRDLEAELNKDSLTLIEKLEEDLYTAEDFMENPILFDIALDNVQELPMLSYVSDMYTKALEEKGISARREYSYFLFDEIQASHPEEFVAIALNKLEELELTED